MQAAYIQAHAIHPQSSTGTEFTLIHPTRGLKKKNNENEPYGKLTVKACALLELSGLQPVPQEEQSEEVLHQTRRTKTLFSPAANSTDSVPLSSESTGLTFTGNNRRQTSNKLAMAIMLKDRSLAEVPADAQSHTTVVGLHHHPSSGQAATPSAATSKEDLAVELQTHRSLYYDPSSSAHGNGATSSRPTSAAYGGGPDRRASYSARDAGQNSMKASRRASQEKPLNLAAANLNSTAAPSRDQTTTEL